MRLWLFTLLLTCACVSQAQVSIITTIAGSSDTAGYCCDGQHAIMAKLNGPEFVCLDKFGNIYFPDCGNMRVRKIDVATKIITTVGGNGTHGYNGDNILATNAEVFVPEGIAVDTSGNIFIADAGNNRIRKIDATTRIITTIAGSGPSGVAMGGFGGDGGLARIAQLNCPTGLAVDKSGNIYIGDYCNDKVRRVDAVTGVITTFAGTQPSSLYTGGFSGYLGDGGLATNAVLSGPIQVYADSVGNVYICDQWNHAVRKVDILTNIITTIAGTGTAGHSGDGGLAINAQLNQPGGIDMDKEGNIFIAEYGSGVIRRIDAATGIISTVAGDDTLGFSGDGGPATNAELRCSDVRVDAFGTLYIADIDNNRIRKVYNPKLAVPNETPQVGIVKLFPNPAGNELHIIYDFSNHEAGAFQLFDVTGRLVINNVLAADKQREVLDILDLAKGVYLFKVVQQDKVVFSGELIKQ